jgi:hypothetical protein
VVSPVVSVPLLIRRARKLLAPAGVSDPRCANHTHSLIGRWHVRDHTHEFLLSLPSHSTADRKALLLKHDQAEERQSCE